MKEHLVMIVGGYYPNPSPTGKCAESYVDLIREQFDVSVICIAGTNRKPYTYNGKQVYPAAGWYTLFQHWLEKKAPRIIQNLAKVPVHFRHRFTQPNNLYSYIKAARKELEKLHRQKNIDMIFSVGAPMAAHVAASQFRRQYPEVRWTAYTVDSYAAQNKGNSQAFNFEKRILGSADRALFSEEIYGNSPMLFVDFKDKCGVLPYLMPSTPKQDWVKQYFDPQKTNLVYAGRFYKTIRNPEYLLRLAMEMDDCCVLHLYCQSDCDSLINDYVARSRGKIVRHAPVSVDEIQKIYMQADILVSVGNNTPEFMPSKTFEYIASGKPILNVFYPGLRDAVLEQYPLALQLERDTSIQAGGEMLCNFIQETQHKQLTREKINAIFYKHSSDNIMNILVESMKIK